jgi:hypothetical protein
MLTTEHKTKIQQIKGGNISLQKFFFWRRRESKRKRNFDEKDAVVGLGFSSQT